MSATPIVDCVKDLEATLQSIAAVANKVAVVYSEVDLMDKTAFLVKPCVGVMYEGTRSIAEGEKQTDKRGISCDANFSIILMFDSTFTGVELSQSAHAIFDELRTKIHARRAPTGHVWRFVVEAPALEKNGAVLWVQRWSCPIQLK